MHDDDDDDDDDDGMGTLAGRNAWQNSFKKWIRTIIQTGAIMLRMKNPGRWHYYDDVIYATRTTSFNTYVYLKIAGISSE